MKKETKELLTKWYGPAQGRMLFGGILLGIAIKITLDGTYLAGEHKMLLDMYKVDSEATWNVVEKLKKH